MRSLLILTVFLLLPLPSHAQRVFRASAIDLEQNERLDDHESRLAKLEARKTVPAFIQPREQEPTVSYEPGPEPEYVYVRVGDTKTIDGETHRLERVGNEHRWMPIRRALQTVSAVGQGRYTTAELKSIAANYRGPTYATVSPASWAWEHLQDDHGFSASQVSGLSQSEALTIHNMAHGNKITPYRSRRSAEVVTQSAPIQRVMQSAGGCPGGRCPTVRRSSWFR